MIRRCLRRSHRHDRLPRVVAQVAEGRGGHPGPEVGAPAPQHRVEPEQQGSSGWFVSTCSAHVLTLAIDGPQGLLGRVGVDVVPVGASFAVTLDAPPEEVEALVDVGDQGLLRRQAQTHRGQDRRDLLPQRLGVRPVPETIRHQSSAYRTSR